MKDETKFLIEIADKFGKDAQNVLDFVAKSGNLEKAAKALNKAEATDIRPTSAITGSNEDLPDGVYFIAENRTSYQLMTDDDTAPQFPAKYIGPTRRPRRRTPTPAPSPYQPRNQRALQLRHGSRKIQV